MTRRWVGFLNLRFLYIEHGPHAFNIGFGLYFADTNTAVSKANNDRYIEEMVQRSDKTIIR